MFVPAGLLQQAVNSPAGLTWVSSTAGYMGGAGPLYVTKPSGVEAGDLLVMLTITRNAYGTIVTGGTWNFFGGYTVGTGSISGGITNNDHFKVEEKIATGSEGANFQINITDQGTNIVMAVCMAIRGASGCAVMNAGNAITSPSLNAEAGDLLFPFHGSVFDGSPPTGTPEPDPLGDAVLVSHQYEASTDVGLAVWREPITVTGATGTRVWNGPANYNNGYNIAGLLAVR